eukprot:Rhum_TRINITY_DN14993_c3_g1::Rhum_TRINITY_DN14993_c3_g1_i4::g.131116::m.131116
MLANLQYNHCSCLSGDSLKLSVKRLLEGSCPRLSAFVSIVTGSREHKVGGTRLECGEVHAVALRPHHVCVQLREDGAQPCKLPLVLRREAEVARREVAGPECRCSNRAPHGLVLHLRLCDEAHAESSPRSPTEQQVLPVEALRVLNELCRAVRRQLGGCRDEQRRRVQLGDASLVVDHVGLVRAVHVGRTVVVPPRLRRLELEHLAAARLHFLRSVVRHLEGQPVEVDGDFSLLLAGNLVRHVGPHVAGQVQHPRAVLQEVEAHRLSVEDELQHAAAHRHAVAFRRLARKLARDLNLVVRAVVFRDAADTAVAFLQVQLNASSGQLVHLCPRIGVAPHVSQEGEDERILDAIGTARDVAVPLQVPPQRGPQEVPSTVCLKVRAVLCGAEVLERDVKRRPAVLTSHGCSEVCGGVNEVQIL